MTSGLDDELRFEAPAGERWRYSTTAYSQAMHVVASAAAGKAPIDLVDEWLVQLRLS